MNNILIIFIWYIHLCHMSQKLNLHLMVCRITKWFVNSAKEAEFSYLFVHTCPGIFKHDILSLPTPQGGKKLVNNSKKEVIFLGI